MEKLIDSLCKGLHYVAQLVLVAMMLMITVDVLGRWIFDFPIKGTYDFTQSGLSMVIFLGLAYTHQVREHISIDFLVEKFPEKIQNILNSIINIFIAGIIILLAFQLWENSQRLFHSNTVTGDLNLPIYIFAIMATIGTTVFALTAVMNAIVYAKKVVSKNES